MNKLIYILCFVGLAIAVWEEIEFIPDYTKYYIVPAFSQNSSTQDFIEIYEFLNSFLQIPNHFVLFLNGNNVICNEFSRQNDALFLGASQCEDITNTSILVKEVYENCVSSNVSQLLTRAYLVILNENNLEKPIRANVIILTDMPVVQVFYDRISIYLQETLFFIFSNAKSNHQENLYPAHQVEQYFYTTGNVSKKSISQLIVNETLTYRFNTNSNKFNVFIVGEESILEYAIQIAENLLTQSDWGNLFPTLYVAALKRNESFYYQSVAIQLDSSKFSIEKLSTRYKSINKTHSTDLVESYFKKSYNGYNGVNFDFIQWNVLITDSFPSWLKNTELIFDSLNHQFDVYLITNNNTYQNILSNLSQNLNDIIVEDENSTQRSNHIILQDATSPPNFEYFPTMKKRMAAATFDYHTSTVKKPNRWWIWLIVGCCLAMIVVTVIVYIFYNHHKNLKTNEIHRPFSPSVVSQVPETASEKQKFLFIEEEHLQIHFNKILGKGTSSLVYEGFLSGDSPIIKLNPRIETYHFTNCIVAVKAATQINKYEFEQVFREVDAAQKMGYHHHICCLLGWTIYQKIPSIILEYVNGTNLHSWIQATSEEEKSDKIIAKILWQIVDAMEHISAVGIVHKDLAARNILLTEMLEVKISDFGLASKLDEKHIYQAICQRRMPLRWMALEALKERLFSEASDIWSFGVLMWEVFNNGNVPYDEMDGNDIVEFLSNGYRLPINENNIWKLLMLECWKEDREERPKFAKIKKQIEIFLDKEDVKYGYVKCVYENEN